MNRHWVEAAVVLTGAALAAIGVTASAATEQGNAKDWSWYQNAAHTEVAGGIGATVWFSEEDLCESSLLIVTGNNGIRYIELEIDGHRSGRTYADQFESGVSVGLTPASVESLKRGHSARLTTNVGSAQLSLAGSAKAIQSAHEICLRRTSPIVPNVSTLTAPQRVNRQGENYYAEATRGNGDLIVATGNAFSGGGIVVLNSIEPGDDVLIERLVEDMEATGIPFRNVVFTYNRGGSLQTAMRIGDFIRRKGASTFVGGLVLEGHGTPYCASACVFAFAGGVQRGINAPARIGMHQASMADDSPGTMEDGQFVLVEAYEYLSRMGVDPALVIEGSKRPPREMWWFSEYEAKGYGLATAVATPHE